MNDYDRMRRSMGYPVDLELGNAVANYHQTRRKLVYEASKNSVIKIICYKDVEGASQQCGFFNGFFYHDREPFVLTAGHVVGFAGATKYVASFYHGTAMAMPQDLQFIKCGRINGEAVTVDGIPYTSCSPDVAVFRCDQQPPHPPRPHAAIASVGDTVFSVGFKGVDEAQLVFSEGIVSSQGMDGITITAYADNGFSGCPVFNMDGFVVGMVVGGDGCIIKQVNTVAALTIQFCLTQTEPVCPGFSS